MADVADRSPVVLATMLATFADAILALYASTVARDQPVGRASRV
jgi:hypothetical protein